MSRLADALLAVVLLAGILLAGSLYASAWAVLFVLSAAAAVAAWRATEQPPRLPKLALAVGGLWGASLALSLLPLPAALVDGLSPGGAWVASLPLDSGGARRLHQAPGEGALNLLHWATAALVSVAVGLRAVSHHGRKNLRGSIVAVGLIAALVCVVWTATGGAGSFGLHPLNDWVDPWMPPLRTPNHWSAWLTMVAGVALAAPMRTKVPSDRGLASGLVGVFTVALIVTGTSRGGFVGLAAVLALLTGYAAWVGPGPLEGWSRGRRIGTTAVAWAVGAAALAWLVRFRTGAGVRGLTGEEFGGLAEEGRLHLLPAARELLGDHLWTGVGRGGLNDVLLRYEDLPGTPLRRFIEVLPVDIVLAHGAVVGGVLVLLLAACVVWALRHGLKRPSLLGPAAALVGLSVHELADYSTWGGAVLLMAVALATLCLISRAGKGSRRAWAAAAAVPMVVGLVALPTALRHGDSRHCFERYVEGTRDRAHLDAFVEREARAHPASGALAFEVGVEYFRLEAAQPSLGWLNRAQLLAPTHPEPHLWTARVLHRAGFASQALAEYRLAAAGDWDHRGRAITLEVAERYPEGDVFERLVPADRPEALAEVALWLDEVQDPRLAALGPQTLELFPERKDAQLAGAAAALAAGDADGAAAAARLLVSDETLTPRQRERLARLLNRSGQSEEALGLLRATLRAAPDLGPKPWMELARWELKAGELGRGRAALRQVRRFGSQRLIAASYLREALVEEEASRPDLARPLVEQAAQADPTWPRPPLHKARLQVDSGDPDGARRTLERAQLAHPDDARIKKALDALP